jgi:hypothetical protein
MASNPYQRARDEAIHAELNVGLAKRTAAIAEMLNDQRDSIS